MMNENEEEAPAARGDLVTGDSDSIAELLTARLINPDGAGTVLERLDRGSLPRLLACYRSADGAAGGRRILERAPLLDVALKHCAVRMQVAYHLVDRGPGSDSMSHRANAIQRGVYALFGMGSSWPRACGTWRRRARRSRSDHVVAGDLAPCRAVRAALHPAALVARSRSCVRDSGAAGLRSGPGSHPACRLPDHHGPSRVDLQSATGQGLEMRFLFAMG